MIERVFFLLLLIVPLPAYASYRDGFFGFLIVTFAIPILLVGIFLTTKYYSKKWLVDRNFTIFYTLTWLFLTGLSIILASLYSIDGGDDESPTIIFWGFTFYYLVISIPAFLQYRNNNVSK